MRHRDKRIVGFAEKYLIPLSIYPLVGILQGQDFIHLSIQHMNSFNFRRSVRSWREACPSGMSLKMGDWPSSFFVHALSNFLVSNSASLVSLVPTGSAWNVLRTSCFWLFVFRHNQKLTNRQFHKFLSRMKPLRIAISLVLWKSGIDTCVLANEKKNSKRHGGGRIF